jgi:hypothetical protein
MLTPESRPNLYRWKISLDFSYLDITTLIKGFGKPAILLLVLGNCEFWSNRKISFIYETK